MPRPDYLCVDAFLRDAVGARALASAFELGVIDELAQGAPCAPAALAAKARLDGPGGALLLGLLEAAGVTMAGAGGLGLTPAFQAALRYRDLLEAKLDFLALVGGDFLELFTMLLADPAKFQRSARVFELFSYDRALEPTPENLAYTSRWMRFTTALTRHEAPAALDRLDLPRHARMLDVGGNSGEFALQACRRQPALRATVHDLPVVCELGARHVGRDPAGARVEFSRAVRGADALPAGPDLVTFKSMLHDWPDAQALDFLRRAHAALAPGGRLAIFERSAPQGGGFPWGAVPLMLFFRAYRAPADYLPMLAAAGFRDAAVQTVELDMPFMLVTALK